MLQSKAFESHIICSNSVLPCVQPDKATFVGTSRVSPLALRANKLLPATQAHKELGLLPKPRRTASVLSTLSWRQSACAGHGWDGDEDGLLRRQSSAGRRRSRRPGSGPPTPSKAQLAAPGCISPLSPASPARSVTFSGAALAGAKSLTGDHIAAFWGPDSIDGSRRTTGDSAPSSSGWLPSPFEAVALTGPAAGEGLRTEDVAEQHSSWLSAVRQPAGQPAGQRVSQPAAISIVATSAGIQVRRWVPGPFRDRFIWQCGCS